MKTLLMSVLILGVVGCAPSPQQAEKNEASGMATTHDATNPPVVDVAGGKLRGYVHDGIFTFVGVQYATAERFMMPKKVQPWEGVKSAQTYGAICPVPQQTEVSRDEFVWPHRYWPENENCQFLNVWTQRLGGDVRKPVMVFLHGGGFTNGSSIEGVAYEGKNLSKFGDVVVVTLNHRLNVLGSLNLTAYGPEFENAGNTGMADIVAALQWIHDNIEAFGGDAGNVTIFGQSGGSGKVVHLMHMPAAQGLFHKAIAESSGNASYLTPKESARIAELTLAKLKLNRTQVQALKTVPYYTLLAAAREALDQTRTEVGREIDFRPILDGTYIEEKYSTWAGQVPLIVGTNFSEHNSTIEIGDGRKNAWSEEEITANLRERLGPGVDEISKEFATLFPHKKKQDAYFFAYNYRPTVWGVLERRISEGQAPVYNYLFAFEAPVNGGVTAFHCAELIYVFHNVDLPEVQVATGAGPDARKMQDVMARAWVNFAYSGNPSQEGLEWKPFTSDGRGTMVFDSMSMFGPFDDRNLVKLMADSAPKS